MKKTGLLCSVVMVLLLSHIPLISGAEKPSRIFRDGKTNRIVEGTVAEPESYPFFGVLVNKEKPLTTHSFCGASLIKANIALTAAHCVVGSIDYVKYHRLNPEYLQLVFNVYNLSQGSSAIYNIKTIITHDAYDDYSYLNDIALIELENDADGISPISLPEKNLSFAGETAVVIGFGALSYEGDYPDDLMQVALTVQENETCAAAYDNVYDDIEFPITERMLCAGYVETGKGSCQGDSGGPLILTHNGDPLLIGIVSWGYECGVPGKFDVYTRVGAYLDWIAETIDSLDSTPEEYEQGYAAGYTSAVENISDTDADGVPNDRDNCPATPKASLTDVNGCAVASTEDNIDAYCVDVDENYNLTIPCFLYQGVKRRARLASNMNQNIMEGLYWTLEMTADFDDGQN